MGEHPFLRIALSMYVGRKCSLCGHQYEDVDDLLARDPVATADGAESLGCRECFENRNEEENDEG